MRAKQIGNPPGGSQGDAPWSGRFRHDGCGKEFDLGEEHGDEVLMAQRTAPAAFAQALLLRRCPVCGAINAVLVRVDNRR